MKVDKNGRSQTLVVGVKLATASREVLTWTLMKVARPGDRVIALHVGSSSPNDSVSSGELKKTPHKQLASSLDAVIGVYETVCSLKEVGFKVKISYGPVRKVLLEETKQCGASKLILGTSKHNALVSPISLARYCVQRLPSTSSVVVVDHGKVAFEKDGVLPISIPGIMPLCKLVHKSLFIKESPPETTIFYPRDYDSSTHDRCKLDIESDHCKFAKSPVGVLNNSKHKKDVEQNNHFESQTTPSPRDHDASTQDSYRPDIQSDHGGFAVSLLGGLSDNKHKEDSQGEHHVESQTDSPESLLSSTDFFQMVESDVSHKISVGGEEARRSYEFPKQPKLSSSTIEPVSGEKPSPRSPLVHIKSSPGWPLMNRAISVDDVLSPHSHAREMSVVEWALRLPGRREQAITEATIETIYKGGEVESPNHKHSKDQIETGKKNLSLTEKLKLLCKSKTCKQFACKVLQCATSNFSTGNLIGKGGCSRVYKGILPDGKSVAVKCLNITPEAEQELLLEVEIMLMLQHKNITSLIGYCIYGQECLLVYNLIPRGNLEENLHGGKDKFVVAWKERLKVAIGVAKALDYLQDGCPRSIIHRDVKSSNILLSEDFEPHLSDFGLAKWAPTSSSCTICNDVSGTFGYLAPEYFMYGRVNEKTDVYSFGVVLLELITGKKPIHTRDPNHHESLVTWARPLLEDGSIRALVDQNLEDAYDEHEMQRMVLAAALCIRKAPRFRPRMVQILKLLQGDGDEQTNWARHRLKMSKDNNDAADDEDGENYESPDIQSHLSLAMLGVDDDTESFDSTDQSSIDLLNRIKSIEDYMGGQLSR
ncbi:hypothetical protein KI387_030194 [Taxus chinensis]|uniref:Protein kinase domain-containing protein n=1 Tax=Taxus chinensis TaxID=29808 RepID=A0AA38FE85_TAXCH|nr:hypothetical protein KI387_030194 [Taxus chinensis]